MKNICLLLLMLIVLLPLRSQSYTTWLTGDSLDVQTAHLPGLLLAGGGTDNDDAMRWLLSRSGGGNVLVIRASGSNGYNDYLYSELGVVVSNVRTIRFNQPTAAYDPWVINQIRQAEALFLAGGDQFNYYTLWRNTPIEDAINYLINEKRAVVGGTSAGMAVLGQSYYTPPSQGVTSAQALANPYHPFIDTLGGGGDFIRHPLLTRTLTDSHYDQRSRRGRSVVFLARRALVEQQGGYLIACNEHTAVAIDESGLARVYGDSQSNDYAYFLQVDCWPDFLPETMQAGQPLHWVRNQAAVKVYQVPGTPTANNYFSLNDWLTGEGGNWQHWWVEQGVLQESGGAAPDCTTVGAQDPAGPTLNYVLVGPNPASDQLTLQWQLPLATTGIQLRLLDAHGRQAGRWTGLPGSLSLKHLPGGVYYLLVERQGQVIQHLRVIKK